MWLDTPLTGRSLPARTLCLTFDDGPGVSPDGKAGPRTLELAHYLAEESIPATFFFVGRHVREHPGVVAQVQELGHVIGNHTFHHRKLTSSSLTDREIVNEVSTTDTILRVHGRELPRFFRPPYGAWSPRIAHLLNARSDLGTRYVGPVNWDVSANDFELWRDHRTPEYAARAYREAIRKRRSENGVVLFHDRSADNATVSRRNQTLAMIRLLVPQLRDMGLSFAPLAEIPALLQRMPAQAERKIAEAGASAAS